MDQSTLEKNVPLSVSHSAKSTYLQCPQKYYLKYGQRLEPILTPKPFRMGSAFSDGLEQWKEAGAIAWYEGYWAKLPEERMRGQEHEARVVRLMVRHYLQRYDKVEREIEIPMHRIGAAQYRGFIDGRESPTILIEDKFKSQWTDTDIEALKLDDQIIGYVAMYSMMSGIDPSSVVVKYRATRKPALRQRKDEHSVDFLSRIEQDVIARLDWYFNEELITIDDDQIMDWWESTRGTAALMELSNSTNNWPRNTGACKQYGSLCDMWSICSAKDELELSASLDDYKEKEYTR